MRNVYFGTNPASLPLVAEEITATTCDPGTLETITTYYWRVDEISGGSATTGDVWSFTTEPGRATNPNPANGATIVALDADLSWSAGVGAETHDVYMGTDPGSLILEDSGLTSPSYDPGPLESGTVYYWRIN